jgi:hypothetical protein
MVPTVHTDVKTHQHGFKQKWIDVDDNTRHDRLMILGILSIVLGLFVILRARAIAERDRARRANRLSQLIAGETEKYFEERRTLELYPATSVWSQRIFGVCSIVGGAILVLVSR